MRNNNEQIKTRHYPLLRPPTDDDVHKRFKTLMKSYATSYTQKTHSETVIRFAMLLMLFEYCRWFPFFEWLRPLSLHIHYSVSATNVFAYISRSEVYIQACVTWFGCVHWLCTFLALYVHVCMCMCRKRAREKERPLARVAVIYIVVVAVVTVCALYSYTRFVQQRTACCRTSQHISKCWLKK